MDSEFSWFGFFCFLPKKSEKFRSYLILKIPFFLKEFWFWCCPPLLRPCVKYLFQPLLQTIFLLWKTKKTSIVVKGRSVLEKRTCQPSAPGSVNNIPVQLAGHPILIHCIIRRALHYSQRAAQSWHIALFHPACLILKHGIIPTPPYAVLDPRVLTEEGGAQKLA